MHKDALIALYYVHKACTIEYCPSRAISPRGNIPGSQYHVYVSETTIYYYDYGTALRCNVVIEKVKKVYVRSAPRTSCGCLFHDGLVKFRKWRQLFRVNQVKLEDCKPESALIERERQTNIVRTSVTKRRKCLYEVLMCAARKELGTREPRHCSEIKQPPSLLTFDTQGTQLCKVMVI